jgi:hypothetical protein
MADIITKTTDALVTPVQFVPGGKPVQLLVLAVLALWAYRWSTGKLPFGLEEMWQKMSWWKNCDCPQPAPVSQPPPPPPNQ